MKEKVKQIIRNKFLIFLVIVIVFVLVIRGFVGGIVVIQGESMNPTLLNSDIVFIEKISYRNNKPKRNDIVVVTTNATGKKMQYVKRIIGLPGETIRIKKGKVFIDGEKLNEIHEFDLIEDGGMAREKVILGEDEYFLLGDNRNNSKDSRNVELGIVKRDQMEGKVFVRIYPFAKIGKIK